jgi:hypothetical protein
MNRLIAGVLVGVLGGIAGAAMGGASGLDAGRETGGTVGVNGMESRASRLMEITLSPSGMNARAHNPYWGHELPPAAERGSGGNCDGTATWLTNEFAQSQWNAQAGFAQQEIFAASYQVSASLFPLRIDTIKGLFVTSATTVTTTTEWTVLVWEGTPGTGTLVASFSSDNIILPHLVMPPGTGATLIEVAVDPNDPEPIVVQNNGSATFSIGFRIDRHNNQTQNPCFIAPPSGSNAFPATDVDGLSNPLNNWLFAIDCGLLGCRAGWSRFSQLGFCTPSGDWALAADWSSLSCTPGVGPCCLPDGSCRLDSLAACQQAGGAFQSEGLLCGDVVCVPLPQACCFPGSGACLNLNPGDCVNAGGVPGGVGTNCSSFTCFPEGACCLPDGSCIDQVSPEDCAALNGTYQGNNTTCLGVSCPLPTGGCCFPNGFCLILNESNCDSVNGTWGGIGSDCSDSNSNGIFDVCEDPGPSGCNPADLAEPFGVLDLGDISAFVSAFTAQDPAADLAEPFGVFDLADLGAFVSAFIEGCP